MAEDLAKRVARRNAIETKRVSLRDQIWPDASKLVWNRKAKENKGFVTVPRVLPLILNLMAGGDKKGNPSRVYLDLWFRVFDDGMVEIKDERDCAYSSSYTGQRATRSWREQIRRLEKLGFIRVAPKGGRDIGFILLINPLEVVASLRKNKKLPIPDEWWIAFLARASEVGTKLPNVK